MRFGSVRSVLNDTVRNSAKNIEVAARRVLELVDHSKARHYREPSTAGATALLITFTCVALLGVS